MADKKAETRPGDAQMSQAEQLPADADAPGNAEVSERFSKALAQGFDGIEIDPTPNENYTVAGVLAKGKETPETSFELRREVRDHIEGYKR